MKVANVDKGKQSAVAVEQKVVFDLTKEEGTFQKSKTQTDRMDEGNPVNCVNKRISETRCVSCFGECSLHVTN